MAKASLSDEVKAFIVHGLACFDPPSIVAEAVKREFEVDVSRQGVEAYDPTKRASRNLAPKWRSLFDMAREEFLKDTGRIAIANRSVRLRALQRMAEKAEGMRNLALAAQLYEQAAKEMGEAYSNRQRLEHTGKDGSPIAFRTIRRVIVDPKVED